MNDIIVLCNCYHTAPPPDNVHLAQVSRNVLSFQWVSVQLVCSDITEYKINAVGCGACPNITLNTSVTCVVSNILTSNTVCVLSVKTTVCGFQSNSSEAVTSMLKGMQYTIKLNLSSSTCHYSPKSSGNQQCATFS